MSPDSTEILVARIHQLLKERGWKIATAESMTAGAVSAALARVAGASSVLLGGMVCYLPEMKTRLGILPEDIFRHGAESMETSAALANGLSQLVPEAEVVLGITGSASPSRPDYAISSDPGEVFVCIRIRHAQHFFQTRLEGDRTSILDRAVYFALKSLETCLLSI